MKNLGAALVCVAIVAGASAQVSRAAPSAPPIATAAQVLAGGKTYAAQCSRCHGANLEGVSAPALRGSGSGLAGDTVSEAFTFISTQMPAGDPGSLSSTEYTNVVAYVLSRNGHQSGSARLTPTIAKASKLKI